MEEYWNRIEHLESRRVLVEERTAEPLTDEEIQAMSPPAVLSYLTEARFELPRLLTQSAAEFHRHEFDAGKMQERGRTGQGECLVNTIWGSWTPAWNSMAQERGQIPAKRERTDWTRRVPSRFLH